LSQRVDDRVKRQSPLPNGTACASTHAAAVAEPLPQLLEEPRLADPGLARRSCTPALPWTTRAVCSEAVGEQAELAVAARRKRARP
jgi:hypothetical protein